ncbi:MAG TPA: hypothetical protein VMT15_10360 [Bryobacteraceae bacterium]|nr:hypothetical protein [Bryobacteraceae bacterium]
MRANPAVFALSLGVALGADTSRVFQFHHIEGTQQVQEVATMVRTIADIRNLSVDTTQASISMTAPEGSIQIAEFLLKELDRTSFPDTVTKAFQVAPDGSDVVRVFYLPNTATIQQFQEVATAVRTVTEIRRVFTYNEPRALTIRGTADQVAAAAWMIQELDQPARAKRTDSAEYKMIDPENHGETQVRVIYAPFTSTVQQFQEVATLIRSIGRIRRVFTYNAAKAITVRGTADQVAGAAWMIHELGTPVDGRFSSPVYHMDDLAGQGDEVVRIFYVKDAPTVQAFQQIATQVRMKTQMRRVFTYNATMALAVRGTADQIAATEQFLKDRQVAAN